MAAPYEWEREFVKLGWLRALSPRGIRLLYAVAHFFDKRVGRAMADRQTLQAVTGLSKTAFHRARAELVQRGLLESEEGEREGKYRTYDCTIYRMVTPVPPLPAEYQTQKWDTYSPVRIKVMTPKQQRSSLQTGTKVSPNWDESVLKVGHVLPPEPSPVAKNDSSNASKKQLGEDGSSPALVLALERAVSLRLPGSSQEVVRLVTSWAHAVQRSPSTRDKQLDSGADAIVKRFGVPRDGARLALEDAVTCLNPAVSTAAKVFNVESVEVIHA